MKNRLKKAALGMLTLALVGTVLVGCGKKDSGKTEGSKAESSSSKAPEKKTVTLWAGGSDNVKVGMQQIVDAFNKEEENADKYQLKLEFIMSGAGAQSLQDRILAAKKSGQKDTNYDLILVSDAEVSSYVQEGGEDTFVKYDEQKIPNLANVETKVSDGEGYLVPYRGTTVVLAYDSAKVATPPKTDEDLYKWIKDHPGRFAYNTPGSGGAGGSFVTSTVYNFLPKEALTSSDEKWKKEWSKGFDLLKELNGSMYKSGGKVVYPNKNQGTLDLLINGEVDMIPTWADMLITNLSNGTLPDTVKMAQTTPSFTGNVDGMAIPTIGSNPEGAQAVMNFMLTDKAQKILLDSMAAIPVIDSTKLDSANSKYLKDLDISSFRTSSLGSLSGELNEEWDREIGTLAQ